MEVKITMKTRKGEYAEAIYDGKQVIVLPGGKVSMSSSEHIVGGTYANRYRYDPEYVDKNGTILKECTFNSPSVAGQFVNGNSCNGYRTWKTVSGRSLDEYLKEKGLK